jgi:hypothetical protein
MLNREEAIQRILSATLQYYYSDINIVTAIADFCNDLIFMLDGQTLDVPEFDIAVLCTVSVNGCDEECKYYTIIGINE